MAENHHNTGPGSFSSVSPRRLPEGRGVAAGSEPAPQPGPAPAGADAAVPLVFTTPARESVQLSAHLEPDQPWPPGSQVRLRSVRLDEPWVGAEPTGTSQLLQKRVATRTGRRADWTPYDALDREIAVGMRLLRHCAAAQRTYPAELASLAGYDVNAAEPFALYLPYRGEPVSRFAGRLMMRDQRAFEVGLFRALRCLEALGVAHRGVSPETVLWDPVAGRAQIVDFSHAVPVGHKPQAAHRSPWVHDLDAASSDPRTDVWSAGALAYYAISGRRPGGGDPSADPAMQSSALRALLPRILADKAADRPSAAEVLDALNEPDPWPTPEFDPTEEDELFERGSREFDRIFPPRQTVSADGGSAVVAEALLPAPEPESRPDPPPTAATTRRPNAGRQRRRFWPFSLVALAFCADLTSALIQSRRREP